MVFCGHHIWSPYLLLTSSLGLVSKKIIPFVFPITLFEIPLTATREFPDQLDSCSSCGGNVVWIMPVRSTVVSLKAESIILRAAQISLTAEIGVIRFAFFPQWIRPGRHFAER